MKVENCKLKVEKKYGFRHLGKFPLQGIELPPDGVAFLLEGMRFPQEKIFLCIKRFFISPPLFYTSSFAGALYKTMPVEKGKVSSCRGSRWAFAEHYCGCGVFDICGLRGNDGRCGG